MTKTLLQTLDRKLRRRSYRYFKWSASRAYRAQRNVQRDPLIIYQMGKVGSSTLVRTFESLVHPYELFQVHALTWPWIEKIEEQYRHASRVQGRPILDEHILASRYLRRLMDSSKPDFRWKVVTLVRDPVARNISTFFQGFPIYFPHLSGLIEGEDEMETRVDRIIDVFLQQYSEHDAPLTWYDEHFKPVFGMDVFDTPFDTSKGYQVYRTDRADVLLMRLEDFDRTLPQAIHEFAGLRIDNIRPANISSQKSYSSAYGAFRKRIDLPLAYVERIYGSRFARHFYSPAELADFSARWCSEHGHRTEKGKTSQPETLLKAGNAGESRVRPR